MAGGEAVEAGKTRKIKRMIIIGTALLGGLALVVVSLIGALWVYSGRLDQPVVKELVKSRLRADLGLSLDWTRLDFAPGSGLRLHGFALESAPSDRDLAPELVRLEALEVDWSLSGLLAEPLRIEGIKLTGLKLALVRDLAGQSSLDRLLPPPAAEPPVAAEDSEGPGLSGLLANLSLPLVLARLELGPMELSLHERVGPDRPTRSWRLSTPALRASLNEAPAGSLPELRLELGGPGQSGSLLLVREQGPESGQVELALRQRLTRVGDVELDFELGLELLGQDLFAEWPSGPRALLRLAGRVRIEADERRLALSIEELDLLGGALRGSALIHMPDEGPGPRIVKLQAAMAGEPLSTWLPEGLLPFQAEGLAADLKLEDLGLDLRAGLPVSGRVQLGLSCAALRLSSADLPEAGLETFKANVLLALSGVGAPSLKADLDLGALKGPQGGLQGLELALEAGPLELDWARLRDTGGRLQLKMSLAGAEQALGQEVLRLERLGFEASLRRERAGSIDLQARLPVAGLGLGRGLALERVLLELSASDIEPLRQAAASARLQLKVDEARLQQAGLAARLHEPGLRLDLKDLRLEGGEPRARLDVRLDLPKVQARAEALALEAQGLAMELEGVSEGALPERLDWRLPVGRLRLDQVEPAGRKRLIELRGAELSGRLDALRLNREAPERSSARLAMRLASSSLCLPEERCLKLNPSSLELNSRAGRRIGSRAALRLSQVKLGAEDLPGDWTLDWTLDADRLRPSLQLEAKAKGSLGIDAALKLQLGYAADSRELSWLAELNLSELALLDRLLPADALGGWSLRWRPLTLRLSSRGALVDLIQSIDRQGLPRLAADPFAATGEARLRLDLQRLSLSRQGGTALELPRLALSSELDKKGEIWTFDQDLRAGRLTWLSGRDSAELSELEHLLKLTAQGSPTRSRITFESQLKLDSLRQSYVAGYPVAKLAFAVTGRIDALQALRIEQIELNNPAAGTRLVMELALDRIARLAEVGGLSGSGMPGRQALRLSGTLEQNLSKLDLKASGIEAQGLLRVPLEIESGDMKAYRLAAQLQAEGLELKMPELGLEISGFDGRIPIVEDLALVPGGGVELASPGGDNLYSQTRFADVHPFLRMDNFIALDRLQFAGLSMGPLAGNLRIEQRRLSLDQFQLGLRGGKVAGQLLVDADPVAPSLFFKGNVTGLRPSGGDDPLDANATLRLAPASLDLSGRVQVLRIGRRHLLDLLDMLDPYREDVSINRVRLGLKVGYPKFMRLKMSEGFLDAKVELGGAVDFVRIDEIKGVPLGPLLNRYVAPHMRALGFGGAPEKSEKKTEDGNERGPEATQADGPEVVE